ncbi:MAG TPA: YdhR family protein [Polyangiaceae bacterium]|nr:YdhR family protein [Polyangiaceae bacterium]
MSQYTHVQIEFELVCTVDEYRKIAEQRAPVFANVAGLVSKLWIIDEAARRAGGAYLFSDRAAATAYLEGPIIAGLRTNPAFRHVSVRLFDVLSAPSEVTHALQGRAS